MNIRNIYNRTRTLIVRPQQAWQEINFEKRTKREAILEYLLPMSVVIGICTMLGSLFFADIEDSISFGYVLINGVISFLIVFLEVILAGWLITEISESFDAKVDSNMIFSLVIYSHAPFFLALAISRLFPQLLFLMITGIYSFFVFWLGISNLLRIDEDKKIIYLFLSSLIMILLFLLLSVIFNSMYSLLVDQFSTFSR
jgi:hypothetical protein